MAIVTRANVKTLLNISTTASDDWIDALIPQVESDYVHIRNRPFETGTKLTVETTGLPADEEMSLELGNYATVGEPAKGWNYIVWLRENDTANMIIYRIINQIKPSGYFNFTVGDSATDSAEVYITERFPQFQENISVLDVTVDASTSITETIEKMQTIYPKGSELTAAQMIHHHLTQHETGKPAGVKSESLGDYSVTYADTQGGYPRSITGQITRYAVML